MSAGSETLRTSVADGDNNSDHREHPPEKISLPYVVQGVINGDEEAATQLDGKLRPRLTRLFSRYNPEFAEELTQETLLKVAEKLPDFDPSLGEGKTYDANFFAWIYRIGKSKLVDHQRK